MHDAVDEPVAVRNRHRRGHVHSLRVGDPRSGERESTHLQRPHGVHHLDGGPVVQTPFAAKIVHLGGRIGSTERTQQHRDGVGDGFRVRGARSHGVQYGTKLDLDLHGSAVHGAGSIQQMHQTVELRRETAIHDEFVENVEGGDGRGIDRRGRIANPSSVRRRRRRCDRCFCGSHPFP